ncbi:hypothetical protein QMK19_05800 [Streptomyces sp. H10-C2]|uniref:SCO2583 family membrane protein n=1 Tax=unclassified Streptomyces TaxID=2593676 RepID=UPI0024BB9D33|nr:MULTISPECIES: hypothetical protein [unclassified Streptomyces]MDJ0340159.1 hypothetical protein [Streptomyces sp. PH10-H1]MDJ0369204.1 hypothetical protein [Streptomyces sp. H10-C2]
MAGPGDPPEGTPEGVPAGGEDEYRSVVFDESFVRAARIQEYSARERLDGTSRAVRVRRVWPVSSAPRQALLLVVLIAIAFGTAIYLGIRHPYSNSAPAAVEPLRITLIPLVPPGPVPSVSGTSLYENQPAGHYRAGAEGLPLPTARRVGDFTESQVMQALSTAKEYLVASSLDPGSVTGGDVRTVRNLIDPGQVDQFDRSLSAPADDGLHEATGWLVRFDPVRVRLADPKVRVSGTITVSQVSDDRLEVVADHTFVYAVQSAGAGADPAQGATSLFTVRRDMRFRFDRDDLRDHHIEVTQADVAAGPMSCSATAPAAYLRPLLAGQSPLGPTAADPNDRGRPPAAVCAALADGSAGRPAARSTASAAAP